MTGPGENRTCVPVDISPFCVKKVIRFNSQATRNSIVAGNKSLGDCLVEQETVLASAKIVVSPTSSQPPPHTFLFSVTVNDRVSAVALIFKTVFWGAALIRAATLIRGSGAFF